MSIIPGAPAEFDRSIDMTITSETDSMVFVVDDDSDVCEGLKGLLESVGNKVRDFPIDDRVFERREVRKGKLSHTGRSYARDRWT